VARQTQFGRSPGPASTGTSGHGETDIDVTVSYVAVRRDGSVDPGMPGASDARLAPFAPGMELQGRYRLESELGRGGFGLVFLGRDMRLDRPVAIKVMLPARPTTMPSQREQLAAMFADEARLGANLLNPAIATVFDYGFHGDLPYTVFEYVPGETLRDLLKRRVRLPLDEFRLIIGPLAQALDFAHSRRVVHRDLKPENIRATSQGQFKILDLGLAREFDRHDDWRFAGTPAYASPEQAAELPSDGRSDQYALALIAFEMLTGRRVFLDRDWRELLEKHRSHPPPSLSDIRPELPRAIGAAIERGLRKDPNRRFATCEEFAVAVGCQFVTPPPRPPELLLKAEIERMSGSWTSSRAGINRRADGIFLVLTPDALWASYFTEVMSWPVQAILEVDPSVALPEPGRPLAVDRREAVPRAGAGRSGGDRGIGLDPKSPGHRPGAASFHSEEDRAETVRVAYLGHEENLGAIRSIYGVGIAVLLFLSITAFSARADAAALAMIGLIALLAAVAYGLSRLHSWARWAAIILALLALYPPVRFLVAMTSGITRDTAEGAMGLFLPGVAILVDVVMLVLLVSPASSVVFSARYRRIRSATPHLAPRKTFSTADAAARTLNLDSWGRAHQMFRFFTEWECRRWGERIAAMKDEKDRTGPEPFRYTRHEPVVLLRQRPMIRHQLLGGIEAKDVKRWRCEAALQIQAAIMGADAVVDVQEERLPEFHRTPRRLSGMAVRAADAEGRMELLSRWFADRVKSYTGLIFAFILLRCSASVLTAVFFWPLAAGLGAGVPIRPALAGLVAGLVMIHAWPMLVAILLRVSQWPQLTRPAAIAVFVLGASSLAAALGLTLSGVVAGDTADVVAGLVLAALCLVDPINLTFLVFGAFLARRVWRTYGDYARKLPDAEPHAPEVRTIAGALAMAASILFGIVAFFSSILERAVLVP
jgi:serine/threonine-protein kinase